MKTGMYHPLVENFDGSWRRPGMTRADCVKLLADVGETAPRSSCVFCPFRTMHEWSVLSDADRARVMEVDRAIGDGFAVNGKHGGLTDRPFLRRDLAPVTGPEWFEREDTGQMAFDFNSECEGICGV